MDPLIPFQCEVKHLFLLCASQLSGWGLPGHVSVDMLFVSCDPCIVQSEVNTTVFGLVVAVLLCWTAFTYSC